jgi:hypothetical protein
MIEGDMRYTCTDFEHKMNKRIVKPIEGTHAYFIDRDLGMYTDGKRAPETIISGYGNATWFIPTGVISDIKEPVYKIKHDPNKPFYYFELLLDRTALLYMYGSYKLYSFNSSWNHADLNKLHSNPFAMSLAKSNECPNGFCILPLNKTYVLSCTVTNTTIVIHQTRTIQESVPVDIYKLNRHIFDMEFTAKSGIESFVRTLGDWWKRVVDFINECKYIIIGSLIGVLFLGIFILVMAVLIKIKGILIICDILTCKCIRKFRK